ncbi:MAG: FKBP-type peptidyl-prolyl cis-trans isomerase [Puniceicoccales bacterium]|jgi:FKBP-type peptidyl-prolyl cis-trans isomerase|nr:FKBP-type peptidyl-prolyl cis-trans isomerase [Puniceicoccales bacterium]
MSFGETLSATNEASNLTVVDDKKAVKPALSDAEKDKLISAYGWFIAKQLALQSLGFTSKELDTFYAGLKLGCDGGAPMLKTSAEMQAMGDFLSAKTADNADAVAKKTEEEFLKNKKEAEAYIANIDKLPGICKTESGLRYKIISKGDEKTHPDDFSKVTIEYEGKLIDGTVFDSNSTSDTKPEIEISYTIKGFKEGLKLIGKGGEIELYILPELGYMNSPVALIPLGSLLIFKIKLLDVSKSMEYSDNLENMLMNFIENENKENDNGVSPLEKENKEIVQDTKSNLE